MNNIIINRRDIEEVIHEKRILWAQANIEEDSDSILMHPSVFYKFTQGLIQKYGIGFGIDGKLVYHGKELLSSPQLNEGDIRIAKTNP